MGLKGANIQTKKRYDHRGQSYRKSL